MRQSCETSRNSILRLLDCRLCTLRVDLELPPHDCSTTKLLPSCCIQLSLVPSVIPICSIPSSERDLFLQSLTHPNNTELMRAGRSDQSHFHPHISRPSPQIIPHLSPPLVSRSLSHSTPTCRQFAPQRELFCIAGKRKGGRNRISAGSRVRVGGHT